MPACLGGEVGRRDVQLRVGEQRHLRRVVSDRRDEADEPVGGHDRIVLADAVARAGRDPDLLLELARRPRDDRGRDVVEARREARQADVFQLALEVAVLVGRIRVLDHLLPQLVDLGPKRRVLRLGVHQAREPAVGVAERARDAFGADLEGPQHRRSPALDAVQPTARRLTEVDRDQDDREQHEHTRHDPPLEGGGTAGGQPRRPGARNGRPQDRKPCGAVPLHENALV